MSKRFGIVKVTYEHKWRNGRWKKFKKVGKLMIKVKRQSNDHQVVTRGQKKSDVFYHTCSFGKENVIWLLPILS